MTVAVLAVAALLAGCGKPAEEPADDQDTQMRMVTSGTEEFGFSLR